MRETPRLSRQKLLDCLDEPARICGIDRAGCFFDEFLIHAREGQDRALAGLKATPDNGTLVLVRYRVSQDHQVEPASFTVAYCERLSESLSRSNGVAHVLQQQLARA